MEALARRLHELCDAQPFTTSWYVRDLATGAVADRAGGVETPSASTRKTSIMMAAFKAVHEGRLDLDEPVRIEAEYQEGVASGTFQHLTPGVVIPLRDAIVHMIITSDNVSTRIVVDRIDLDELNAYCRAIGLAGTVHRFKIPPLGLPWDHPVDAVTTTTPADQGRLLEMILAGAADEQAAAHLGSTSQWCRYALDILSWQVHRSMIPALLPFGGRICNKTGRGVRGRSDAGLVYRGAQPLYVLTAFVDHIPEELPDGMPGWSGAVGLVARLSRACWDGIG